jgi:hypothetical protein
MSAPRLEVVGFKPANDRFKEMKAVWDACVRAGISVPAEVRHFFHDKAPDDQGVEVPLAGMTRDPAVTPYKAEMEEGFNVDLTKLDPDVKILRFTVRY